MALIPNGTYLITAPKGMLVELQNGAATGNFIQSPQPDPILARQKITVTHAANNVYKLQVLASSFASNATGAVDEATVGIAAGGTDYLIAGYQYARDQFIITCGPNNLALTAANDNKIILRPNRAEENQRWIFKVVQAAAN